MGPDPLEQSYGLDIEPGLVDGDSEIPSGPGMYPFPDKKTNKPYSDPLTEEPDNNQDNMLPGDEFIDDFRSVDDFDISPEEKETFDQQLQDQVEPEESFSIFGAIKNVFMRLGTKFGYIKKSSTPDTVVHDGRGAEHYYEFQCMTADDQPIMINNQPVMVSEPQDCHQYYSKGQEEGHASQLDPPNIYMESARTVFKSKDSGVPYHLTPCSPILLFRN